MYLKLKSYFTSYFAYAIILLVAGIAAYFYFHSKDTSDIKTFTVTRASVEDRVLFSGNVKPADKVALSFEKTGRITSLPITIGKQVRAGDTLAIISSADSQSLLDQAKANLLAERATLADLKRGTRPETIDVAKTKVANAERSLADGLQNVRDALNDAYTKADDALHNTLDPLYSNDTSTSPTFLVLIPDLQLRITIETLRVQQEETLLNWRKQNLQNYPELTTASLALLEKYLQETKTLLDSVAAGLAIGQSNGVVTQSNLDTWRAAVGVARTTIATSMSKLNAADQAYIASQSALTLAKQDLAILQAGSSEEAIAAQEARVVSAQAKVAQYQVEVNKSTLISPITGIVSSKDTELGQIVSPNQQIVSIISNQNFQIEANVSELDIGKLTVGMYASTTLDAYGNEIIFPARIVRIDPAETVVENSPAYGVLLEFVANDSRIKSGMTANINIVIARKDGVLAVPIRTITKTNGISTVKVLDQNNVTVTKTVTTGLVSPSGMVEIVNGLGEGERIVLPQGL